MISIKNKLDVYKLAPTHTRLSELLILTNIDLQHHTSDDICQKSEDFDLCQKSLTDFVIEQIEIFLKNKHNIEPIKQEQIYEKKSLDILLKENVGPKLYELLTKKRKAKLDPIIDLSTEKPIKHEQDDDSVEYTDSEEEDKDKALVEESEESEEESFSECSVSDNEEDEFSD